METSRSLLISRPSASRRWRLRPVARMSAERQLWHGGTVVGKHAVGAEIAECFRDPQCWRLLIRVSDSGPPHLSDPCLRLHIGSRVVIQLERADAASEAMISGEWQAAIEDWMIETLGDSIAAQGLLLECRDGSAFRWVTSLGTLERA